MPLKISVVIPTLNEERYIGPTLFHLKSQKPHEIIVADSRSEDNTRKIAKKYGCKIVLSRRGSPSYGRNAGARAAKGDVVVFMDADTIAFPTLLETIRKDFSRDRKLVGWTCPIYAFTPSWKEQIIYNMSNTLVEFLTEHMKKPHAPGIIIAARRKQFLQINGFDENLHVMEDHDMAIRIGKLGNFKFCKDTCVFTSTRRMDKWGGLGLIRKYSKIYLTFFIRKKKFYKNIKKIEYEVIR